MQTSSPREASDAVYSDRLNKMHTAYAARVVKYYPAKQTVDVQLAVMREVPGESHEEALFEEVPKLVGIPLQFPRAGGFVITMPVTEGDWVEVICGTANTLIWREKGGVNQRPGLVGDEFGLNGAWARPGCFPDNREHTLKDVDTENFVIRRVDGGPVITIKPDSSVQIKSGDIVAGNGPAPQTVALSPLVEEAIKSAVTAAVTGHTHGVTGAATGNGILAALVEVPSTGASHLKAT